MKGVNWWLLTVSAYDVPNISTAVVLVVSSAAKAMSDCCAPIRTPMLPIFKRYSLVVWFLLRDKNALSSGILFCKNNATKSVRFSSVCFQKFAEGC